MDIRGLARLLILKYAIGTPDTSLGAPIPAEKAHRWKELLLSAYDQIRQDLPRLPFFQQLYSDLQEEPLQQEFNDLIYSYFTDISKSSLKDAFLFGTKYVDAFNKFRDKLVRGIKDRDRLARLDEAIYRLQNHIWIAAKNILNLHDIGSGPIPLSQQEQAELGSILKQVARGTWRYGPLRNPTKPLLIARREADKTLTEQTKSLMKRLEEEMKQEERAKKTNG